MEKPNLQIEPEYFNTLVKILKSYEEMMSDDEEDEEENEEELALCEVLQDRIAYLI